MKEWATFKEQIFLLQLTYFTSIFDYCVLDKKKKGEGTYDQFWKIW